MPTLTDENADSCYDGINSVPPPVCMPQPIQTEVTTTRPDISMPSNNDGRPIARIAVSIIVLFTLLALIVLLLTIIIVHQKKWKNKQTNILDNDDN